MQSPSVQAIWFWLNSSPNVGWDWNCPLDAGGGDFMVFFVPPERQHVVKTRLQKLIYLPFSTNGTEAGCLRNVWSTSPPIVGSGTLMKDLADQRSQESFRQQERSSRRFANWRLRCINRSEQEVRETNFGLRPTVRPSHRAATKR